MISWWSWDQKPWMDTPQSPKLQRHWNLTIRLFILISRTLVGVVLFLCMLYSRNHNIDIRTSMNERTHVFIKIYLSLLILERVDVSVVSERWVERHIYSERGLFLSISSSRCQGCQRLRPLASLSETPLIGCVSLARLRFSALSPNLPAWFSSRDLLAVTYLFALSTLIVLFCLLITTWQLVKVYRVTRNERKIHGICYITCRGAVRVFYISSWLGKKFLLNVSIRLICFTCQ